MEASPRYRSGFYTAFARSQGLIDPLASDPGAYAPGFMLSRAARAI
jgi:hypothetical protein